MIFKVLNEEEKGSYREWAQIHYEPLTEISGVWHPVVQAECAKINEAYDAEIRSKHNAALARAKQDALLEI